MGTLHDSRRITQFECPILSEKIFRESAATGNDGKASDGFSRSLLGKSDLICAVNELFHDRPVHRNHLRAVRLKITFLFLIVARDRKPREWILPFLQAQQSNFYRQIQFPRVDRDRGQLSLGRRRHLSRIRLGGNIFLRRWRRLVRRIRHKPQVPFQKQAGLLALAGGLVQRGRSANPV